MSISQEEIVARQAELIQHMRDVIMCFNPKHYFVEQAEWLNAGQASYWSEISTNRARIKSHEETIARLEAKVRGYENKERHDNLLQLR